MVDSQRPGFRGKEDGSRGAKSADRPSSVQQRLTDLLRDNRQGSAQELSPSMSYAIVFAVAGGMLLLAVTANSLLMVIFALCLLMLGFGRLWTVPTLLLMVQIHFLVFEPASRLPSDARFGPSVLAMIVLVLLISGCRYLTLTAPLVPWEVSGVTAARLAFRRAILGQGQHDGTTGLPPRQWKRLRFHEAASGVLRAVSCVILTNLLLSVFPLPYGAPDYAALLPTALRTILIAFALIGLVVAIGLVLDVLVWRRWSPGQSRLYLQSITTGWTHREVRSVVKRILKRPRPRSD